MKRRIVYSTQAGLLAVPIMVVAMAGVTAAAPTQNVNVVNTPAVSAQQVFSENRATSLMGNRVVWPSREFSTLQSAIDTLADGGTLRIRPGIYEIPEPVFIVGKRIVIEGGGCSGNAGGRATVLMGPRPTTVVEPSSAVGLMNYVNGAGGVLKRLELSGFDATVLIDDRRMPSRNQDAGASPAPGVVNPLCPSPQLEISEVCLHDTGRGVLAYTNSRIAVEDSKIADCSWNGISLVGLPNLAEPQGYNIANVFMQDVKNVGLLIKDSPGVCDACHTVANSSFGDCGRGGIVAVRSGICISDSYFAYNAVAAIGILQSAALVQNCAIFTTDPIEDPPSSGKLRFGDGIVVSAIDFPSEATVLNTHSDFNFRAGVGNFGSKVALGNNQMTCNSFDMAGEDVDGYEFQFTDLGGNSCGCVDPNGSCTAETVGIEAPDPADPIE